MQRDSAGPVKLLEQLPAVLLLQMSVNPVAVHLGGIAVLHDQDLVDPGDHDQQPDQQAFMPAKETVYRTGADDPFYGRSTVQNIDCEVLGETPGMTELVADNQRLERHERGRQAFLAMMRAWRSRSGLSLSDLAELCEAAMRADLAPGVQDWKPGPYVAGELVVSHGHVWRAKAAIKESTEAPQRSGHHDGFEPVANVRRLYSSQLHTLETGKAQNFGPAIFDTLGTLNHWLAELRRGQVAGVAEKLAEKALQASVIEDSDGPYGPEELLAVYLGLLQPPFSVTRMTQEQANQQSLQLARRIRQGMVKAGLDLVDDWSRLVAVYPTSDKERLAKVRDVALGRASWSAEQVEDEAAAAEIALAKLSRSAKRAAEGNG